MSNLNLSLVAGYAVEAPSQEKRAAAPSFSFTEFFERLSDRMYAKERARAESDVAQFIADNGGVLTDELERRISRRYGRIVE